MPIQVNGVTYFTASEVAQKAGITRQTLWRWRQSGDVPSGRQHHDRRQLFTEQEVGLVCEHSNRVGSFVNSSKHSVYLDNASTTRPLPEVIEAMTRVMSCAANASSAHSGGTVARNTLDAARVAVSTLCGAVPEEVVFTSGGTEANCSVLLHDGVCSDGDIQRVITTKVEHSSVLDSCSRLEERGVEVRYVDVDRSGLVNIADVASFGIDEKTLVSIQWVNNETGVIQPINELGELVRSSGGLMHTDASQAVGKINVHFDDMKLDFMTCTAHKFHGPQGIGAILVKNGSPMYSFFAGGGQERSRRPGTENTPGIAGFGVAATVRHLQLSQFLLQARSLRDYLETELCKRFNIVSVVGTDANRIGSITNLQFSGVDGQALVAMLDSNGVLVSQSSACINMRPEPSYVLRAMGLSEEEAYECVRFCVAADTEFKDVMFAVEEISNVLQKFGVEPRSSDQGMKRSEVA